MVRCSVGAVSAALFISCWASAADSPPCEPGPACALRMAREITMDLARREQDPDRMTHWVEMTAWIEEVDIDPDPGAASARFAELRSLYRRLPKDEDSALNELWLASAMANRSMFAEAEKLAAGIPVEHRDRIYANLAKSLARHGRWREAVRLLEKMKDNEGGRGGRPLDYLEVTQFLAEMGQPAIIEQAAALMKKPPVYFVPLGQALAELAAGNDSAAIARAMSHAEWGWRVSLLDSLATRYRDSKRDLDALRLDAMKLEQAQGAASKEWLSQERGRYFDRLVEAGQYSRALEWWPRYQEELQEHRLQSILDDLSLAADIETARKLIPGISAEERERALQSLSFARVMAGQVEPKTALREFADVGKAGDAFLALLGNREVPVSPLSRSIFEAAREVASPPQDKWQYAPTLLPLQIRFGLFEEARQSAAQARFIRYQGEELLKISAAEEKAGRAADAQATRLEAMKCLAADPGAEPDYLASALFRAGLLNEAELELRRVMEKKLPNFSNLGKALIAKRVERGEVTRAFQLAADWSARSKDPYEIATFFSLAKKTHGPPIFLGVRQLKKLLSEAEGR